jgi:hypothetical protein
MKTYCSAFGHAAAALAVSVAAFLAASAVMFLILWEFVYGDTYGGRWQKLAWPFGTAAAIVALALYYMRTVYRVKLGWVHFAVSGAILAIVAWVGVLIATNFLMPLPIPR